MQPHSTCTQPHLTLIKHRLALIRAAHLHGLEPRNAVLALSGAVALQYALGVATLLAVVPVWLGTLHQSIAVLVLAAALAAIHGLRRPRATASLTA
jgi:cytochrome c oxidase assembly protein subunit 15